MFSYTFLMIDDLKKIENLRLFTIFHFSWHSVTIFKYMCVHKKYENFYSTLELLLIIHGQYYFQNILFAKHHYLNDILLILTLIETRLTTLPKQTNLKFLFLFSLFQSISSNRKSRSSRSRAKARHTRRHLPHYQAQQRWWRGS